MHYSCWCIISLHMSECHFIHLQCLLYSWAVKNTITLYVGCISTHTFQISIYFCYGVMVTYKFSTIRKISTFPLIHSIHQSICLTFFFMQGCKGYGTYFQQSYRQEPRYKKLLSSLSQDHKKTNKTDIHYHMLSNNLELLQSN